MDPLRIVARILFAWVVVLAMLRVSGKRTVKQGDLGSFVVALVLGDLFDDLFWSEVGAAQFVTASGTIVLLHLLVSIRSFRRGQREWHAAAGSIDDER